MDRSRPLGTGEAHGATARLLAAVMALIVLGSAALTAVAMRRWWLPPLASEHGAAIDRLFALSWWIIAAVFLLVHAALIAFVYRFAARPEARAAYWHESRRLELAWTLAPAAVLVVLIGMGGLVWAQMQWGSVQAVAANPDTVVVEVTAEQFGWRVRYPGPDGRFGTTDPRLISQENPLGLVPDDPAGRDDIVTLGELRLPVDRPAVIQLKSKDVIHSFFVPSLRVKQDAVPGRTLEVRFVPTRTGTYEIACAELCGVGHFAMRGQLFVLTDAEFEQWLAQPGTQTN